MLYSVPQWTIDGMVYWEQGCHAGGDAMAVLSKEIAAYDHMRNVLETDYFGKWVVVHDEKLVGTYETFEDAADDAIRCFGRGPYLIRQVGAPPITLPASIVYRPIYD